MSGQDKKELRVGKDLLSMPKKHLKITINLKTTLLITWK